MGEPKPQSFGGIAAAEREKFISYREAIEKLAAETGDGISLKDIAGWLLSKGVGQLPAAFMGDADNVVRDYVSASGPGLVHLLEETFRRSDPCRVLRHRRNVREPRARGLAA